MNRYKEYILNESQGMNSIDDCNTLIDNDLELRKRGAIIIYPRTLIIYIIFILVFSGGALAAGYAWRSIEEEHLIKVQQITSSHHELTAKNENQNSSIRVVEDRME